MGEVKEEELEQQVEEKEPEVKKKHPVRNLIIFGSVVTVLAGGITLGSYLLRDQHPEITKKANPIVVMLDKRAKDYKDHKNDKIVPTTVAQLKNVILYANDERVESDMNEADLTLCLYNISGLNYNIISNYQLGTKSNLAIQTIDYCNFFDENHQKEAAIVDSFQKDINDMLESYENREPKDKLKQKTKTYFEKQCDIFYNNKPVNTPEGSIRISDVNDMAKVLCYLYLEENYSQLSFELTAQESYDLDQTSPMVTHKQATLDKTYLINKIIEDNKTRGTTETTKTK